MSTTFALSRLISGEGLPSAEGIAPFCDISSQCPKAILKHASRELRNQYTPNTPNESQIKNTKEQLENLFTKPSTNNTTTNQNRIR